MKYMRSNLHEYNQFSVKELHSSLHSSFPKRATDHHSNCTTANNYTLDTTRPRPTFVPTSSWHSSSSASSIPLRVLGVSANNPQLEEKNSFSAPLKLWGSIKRLFDAIIPVGPFCHHPEDSPSDSNIELSLRNETVISITSAQRAHYQLTNKAYHSPNRCTEDASELELKSFTSETGLSLPFSRSVSATSNQESKIRHTHKDIGTNTLFNEAIFDRDDPNSGSSEREHTVHSPLFPSIPPHSSTLIPMEPLSPFKRSRVPIDSSKLHTFRDYSPTTNAIENLSKVRPHPSPQSPLRNSDLVSSLSIPTSPTSPRSPCMAPKAFSNKPPRPTPSVVKVIPTSPSEFMPTIAQTQKERSRHIPRPIPLKRQPSSLAQHQSHLSFSSNRSSSRDIPMFANAASRAYVKSVSHNSNDNDDAVSISFSHAPTSPVSPKPSHTSIPPLHPRSKLRPASPTRVKSAMTPISFNKANTPMPPVRNGKAEITHSGASDVNTSSESKSSVFKSTSSFFQAARGKSFSVSSRLASSLASGKSESTIPRSLPRNVRRVLRPSKGAQNLKSHSATQQQSTVPFFKPLQLSEAAREENSRTQRQNQLHGRVTSLVEGKQFDYSKEDDGQDCETSSSFFNVTSSSLFRTSSASSTSTVSRKSFLTNLRPQLKVQREHSSKSKTKSETLPKVFPRGSKSPKTASTVIPRGRTSGDLSTAHLSARTKQEKAPQKPQSLVHNDTLLKSQVPDRPRQNILAGKNLISSRRPPLLPKKSSGKAHVAVQIFKGGKEEKSVATVMSRSDELPDNSSMARGTDSSEDEWPFSESNRNLKTSSVYGVKEQLLPFEYTNRGVIETPLPPNGDDAPCSEDSFNPDSDESMWCPTSANEAGVAKTESGAGGYRDGNSILLPRTMSVVKFPKIMINGPLASADRNNSASERILKDEADRHEDTAHYENSSSREAQLLPGKSAIFQYRDDLLRNEKGPLLTKSDASRTSEAKVADVGDMTLENESETESETEIDKDDEVRSERVPTANDEPLKRFDSQTRPRTEPALGSSPATFELSRRQPDSVSFDSYRYGMYPAYRMLSDWFESELQESDLSPCVLPDEDDLGKLSHISPVQWAAQPLQSCRAFHCPHHPSPAPFPPWRAASMPSMHTVLHSNRGGVICPYSTMVWSNCPCVTGISCQSSSMIHQQSVHVTGGLEQSTNQLLSPPTGVDNPQVNCGFRRFTGDLSVDRRIMHLELIQRQLREKIRLSKQGGKTFSPNGTEIHHPHSIAQNEDCQTFRSHGMCSEPSLRQIGVVL